ncbi:MAG: Lrp/AsnC family transcriptional regulator [Burkholderiales bacterium]|nr:Lrp/AsnC family transcriptional regulator [Burkholderiales bacterium]
MTEMTIDGYDVQLLNALQSDGRATNSALGEKIHLSTSQVSRRVQRLEECGLISHYAAVLNSDMIGLDVVVYTHVTLSRQAEQASVFEKAIMDLPEVLECQLVTGEADYILRIAAPDLTSFSDFLEKKILSLSSVANVRSIVSLKTVKRTSSLPLGHLSQPRKVKTQLLFTR